MRMTKLKKARLESFLWMLKKGYFNPFSYGENTEKMRLAIERIENGALRLLLMDCFEHPGTKINPDCFTEESKREIAEWLSCLGKKK